MKQDSLAEVSLQESPVAGRAASANLAALLIQKLPIGVTIWRLDKPKSDSPFRLLSANPIAASLASGAPQALAGKTMADSFPDLLTLNVPAASLEALRCGSPIDLGSWQPSIGSEPGEYWSLKAFPLSSQCVGITFERAGLDAPRSEKRPKRERRYRGFFEQAIEGIFRTSRQGRLLTANLSLAQMLGYDSPEALIAGVPNVQQLYVDPSRRAELLQLLEKRDRVSGFEAEFYRREGSPIWIAANIRAIRDSKGRLTGLAGMVMDITQRKQMEEAVRASEERLRAVIETARDAIVSSDRQGCVHSWNRGAETMFGYTAREILGKPLTLLMPHRFREAHQQGLARLNVTGESHVAGRTLELAGLRKDGTEFPIELSLSAWRTAEGSFITAIIRDITERKQAEETHGRLAAIVESSEDAIIGGTLEGLITSWNRGAERLYGYAAEEVLGRSLLFLAPPHYLDESRRMLKQIAQGEQVEHVETVQVRKDGAPLHVSLTWSPIRDASRELIGASLIARDITERKRLEKEILEAGEKERQRIGQDLHDDLCQHLSGIAFLSQALAKRLAARAPAASAQAAHIAELTNQAISRTREVARGLSPAQLSGDDFTQALEELAANIQDLFSVSCALAYDDGLAIEDPVVASHLYRIAQEAIHNAIKHGQAKRVVVRLSRGDGRLTLTIEDDGIGLSHPIPKDTGMGLRGMRYRAGIMGGSLDIRERSSGGTIVTCSLEPARKGAA